MAVSSFLLLSFRRHLREGEGDLCLLAGWLAGWLVGWSAASQAVGGEFVMDFSRALRDSHAMNKSVLGRMRFGCGGGKQDLPRSPRITNN